MKEGIQTSLKKLVVPAVDYSLSIHRQKSIVPHRLSENFSGPPPYLKVHDLFFMIFIYLLSLLQ